MVGWDLQSCHEGPQIQIIPDVVKFQNKRFEINPTVHHNCRPDGAESKSGKRFSYFDQH